MGQTTVVKTHQQKLLEGLLFKAHVGEGDGVERKWAGALQAQARQKKKGSLTKGAIKTTVKGRGERATS